MAVFCPLDRPLNGCVLVEIPVLPAVCPVQDIVICAFNPDGSFVSSHHKSDHIACQCIIWIIPIIILLQPDTVYMGIVLFGRIGFFIFCGSFDFFLKCLGCLIIHTFCQNLIPAVRAFVDHLAGRFFRNTEKVAQRFDCRIHIFLV